MSAAPPTREQVARFGHIAARLRAYLKMREMSVADLCEELGLDRDNSRPYPWIAGKGAPNDGIRAKLAKVTGIPEADLMRRGSGDPPPSQAVALAPAAPRPITTRVGDILSFAVTATGEARIKLDIVLPLANATPLLRMLLDAGVVLTGETVE